MVRGIPIRGCGGAAPLQYLAFRHSSSTSIAVKALVSPEGVVYFLWSSSGGLIERGHIREGDLLLTQDKILYK